MPTYKNAGTVPVTIGNTRMAPGETVKTYQFLPGTLPANITEESLLPSIEPIISSTKLTSGATVTVPESITDPISGDVQALNGNYKITVYVGIGEATVQVNGQGVAKYVGLYNTYSLQCLSRTVGTLVIVTAGTVYVTIEKI